MNLFVELLFPRRCAICDKPVDKMGHYVCKKCESTLRYVDVPYCMKCGKSLESETKEFCLDCQNMEHFFKRGRALYEYESIKESIYRFKYEGRKEYAEFYGKELAKRFGEQIKEWKVDAVIPVPMHLEKEKKRGYNQAFLIAKVLGRELNMPVRDEIVTRVRATLAQKQLKGKERQNNLKNAFKISQNDVKLYTIIIIDDIYTTGSTIDALAEQFRVAGIGKIYFLTISGGR